jgi:hypothetical protein
MLAEGREDRAAEGGYRRNDGFPENPSSKPTLAEIGLSKNLAHRARTFAAMKDAPQLPLAR